jgi:hypothetical protein
MSGIEKTSKIETMLENLVNIVTSNSNSIAATRDDIIGTRAAIESVATEQVAILARIELLEEHAVDRHRLLKGRVSDCREILSARVRTVSQKLQRIASAWDDEIRLQCMLSSFLANNVCLTQTHSSSWGGLSRSLNRRRCENRQLCPARQRASSDSPGGR